MVEYNDETPLGSLEPIVLYQRLYNGKLIGFHVTECEFAQLNGGRGKLRGRTPWGPWCWLKVYDYRVVGVSIIRDREVIREIKEELES